MAPVIPSWIITLAAIVVVSIGIFFFGITAFLAARSLRHREKQ